MFIIRIANRLLKSKPESYFTQHMHFNPADHEW
jgi:hypothetical protein